MAIVTCYRAHGDPSFPDPVYDPNDGRWHFAVSPGSAPGGTQRACQHLFPTANASPPVPQAQFQALVRLAECIRQHGVPTWPDPDPDGSYPLPPSLRPRRRPPRVPCRPASGTYQAAASMPTPPADHPPGAAHGQSRRPCRPRRTGTAAVLAAAPRAAAPAGPRQHARSSLSPEPRSPSRRASRRAGYGPAPARAASRSVPVASAPVLRTDLSPASRSRAPLVTWASSSVASESGGGLLTWLPAPGDVVRRGQAAVRRRRPAGDAALRPGSRLAQLRARHVAGA